jgi:hypothetical protein
MDIRFDTSALSPDLSPSLCALYRACEQPLAGYVTHHLPAGCTLASVAVHLLPPDAFLFTIRYGRGSSFTSFVQQGPSRDVTNQELRDL